MVAAPDLTVCRQAGVPMECLAPGLCASTSGAPGAPSLPGQQPGRGGPWARPPWGGSWLWGQALAVPCGVRSSQRGKAWKPLASPCARAAVPKKPLPRGHNDRALVAPWEGWGDPRAPDTVPSGAAEVPQSGVLPYKGNPFPRGDDGVTPAQYGSTDTRGEPSDDLFPLICRVSLRFQMINPFFAATVAQACVAASALPSFSSFPRVNFRSRQMCDLAGQDGS